MEVYKHTRDQEMRGKSRSFEMKEIKTLTFMFTKLVQYWNRVVSGAKKVEKNKKRFFLLQNFINYCEVARRKTRPRIPMKAHIPEGENLCRKLSSFEWNRQISREKKINVECAQQQIRKLFHSFLPLRTCLVFPQKQLWDFLTIISNRKSNKVFLSRIERIKLLVR